MAAGILRFRPREEQEDWRTAVVECVNLYTNETFAFDNSDLSSQEKRLSRSAKS